MNPISACPALGLRGGSGWVLKGNAVGFPRCLFSHSVVLGLWSSQPQEQVRRLIWSSQDSLALSRDSAGCLSFVPAPHASILISSPGTRSLLMMTAKATCPALSPHAQHCPEQFICPVGSALLTPHPQIGKQRQREAKELAQVSGLQVYRCKPPALEGTVQPTKALPYRSPSGAQ